MGAQLERLPDSMSTVVGQSLELLLTTFEQLLYDFWTSFWTSVLRRVCKHDIARVLRSDDVWATCNTFSFPFALLCHMVEEGDRLR